MENEIAHNRQEQKVPALLSPQLLCAVQRLLSGDIE